jgi:uncharacterized protein (DUF924 family)
MSSSPQDVVTFWRDAGKDRWFAKDAAFDAEIAARFGLLREQAEAGALASWAASPDGALALVILLDQFPRNIFRGTGRAFATDAAAREVAAEAISAGFDRSVEPGLRGFFYLPFMHSENMADQDSCLALYEAAADESGLEWARVHRDIIAQFGRFPHRNEALGRDTTPEEAEFLSGDGFKG